MCELQDDPYRDIAERYDLMKIRNPAREAFFKTLFTENHVRTVLDCACGTGQDLLMFHSFNCQVFGSDISDAMLLEAKKKLLKNRAKVRLEKSDFRNLHESFNTKFDAVVCLSNSINELLDDPDVIKALKSMKAVLETDGILVVDQGQTDASMKNPPRFVPMVNNRDFSRIFVMEYLDNIMDVNILDFIHTEKETNFRQNRFRIRIRLQDDWSALFKKAGFERVTFYGGWKFEEYDKKASKRLIAVARLK